MNTQIRQHFNEEYGSKPPQNYERFFVPTIGEPLAKDLIRKADLRPGERVLDTACGTGIIARLALKEVGNEGRIAGLDVNPGMINVARSITTDLPIEWHQASAEQMPFVDESFDVVICQMGLQFMENKAAALLEMRRVLAPGGRLILNVPGPAGAPFAILAKKMGRTIGPDARKFVEHVFMLNDVEAIRELMQAASFSTVEIQEQYKMLALPTPKKFLWQYISSTPLYQVVAEADEKAKAALEQQVVAQWQQFVDDTSFVYEQRIVTVRGVK